VIGAEGNVDISDSGKDGDSAVVVWSCRAHSGVEEGVGGAAAGVIAGSDGGERTSSSSRPPSRSSSTSLRLRLVFLAGGEVISGVVDGSGGAEVSGVGVDGNSFSLVEVVAGLGSSKGSGRSSSRTSGVTSGLADFPSTAAVLPCRQRRRGRR
jgi:hypothetical protein